MGKEKKETTKKSEDKKEKKLVKKEKKKDTKKVKKEKKVGVFKSIINFFKGVKNEMGRVTWPSKKNMIKYTIASVVFIIFFALFFYGIEVVMAWVKSIIVVL